MTQLTNLYDVIDADLDQLRSLPARTVEGVEGIKEDLTSFLKVIEALDAIR